MTNSGPPLRYIAHRCQGFGSPENSEPALRAALESGAEEVELDLYYAGDNRFYASHWPRWAAANSSPRMELSTVLELLGTVGAGKGLRLDLKSRGCEEELVSAIELSPFRERIVVMSLRVSTLEQIRTFGPEFRTSQSIVVSGASSALDGALYRRAMRASKNYWSNQRPHVTLASLLGSYPQSLIERAVAECAEVVVCVGSPDAAHQLSALGVRTFLSKVPFGANSSVRRAPGSVPELE